MTVDHLVVGGGAAGCVLADILSRDPDRQVLLLEAGADFPPDQEPADILDSYPIVAYFNPKYHWTHLRVALRESNAELPRRRYEQAKVMGGGTSINGTFAFRGLPADYDGWDAMGARGWRWADVLPHFIAVERDLDHGDEPLHGSDGPLPIRRIPRAAWPGFSTAVARALEAQGLADIRDHNGAFGTGFFPMAIANEAGQRVSAARAFLTAGVRARPNLQIRAQVAATRLVFDGRSCIGVDTEGGRIAARETILAAGALQTPALLMRSGVGPADHLRAHGIAVVAHRPGVGANLMDHPMVAIAAWLRRDARCPADMRRHIHLGLRYSSGLAGCPDGDMFVLPSNRAAWHPLGRRLASLLACINKPASRGAVRLSGPAPELSPDIRFKQLTDERDLTRLEQGMHRLWAILASPEVRAVTAESFPASFSERVRALGVVNRRNWWATLAASTAMEAHPAIRRHVIDRIICPDVRLVELLADRSALRHWIVENACGSWHASGTCKMGAPDDPYAVCDPTGRVIGMAGLRVVDASLMPDIPAANTALPTMMMAHKIAAEIIRNPTTSTMA